MKKTIITLAAAFLLVLSAIAQKPSVGITAGATISNYKAKADGEDQTAKSKAGFTGGLIANIPAGKNFMIQTGAHWVQKGTKDEQAGDKVSITVNSIEVPVNFLYNNNGFFIGAGPSVSFAVSGKGKFNDLSAKMHFGNSDADDMRGFDFGANVLTGYQSPGGFLITANFNQGFSNLMPGSSTNGSLKSHYFGIRLGYILNAKKS
jgi:hypothetical protein